MFGLSVMEASAISDAYACSGRLECPSIGNELGILILISALGAFAVMLGIGALWNARRQP